jgi:hypothetical protein
MTLRTLLVVDAVLAFVSALALLVIPGQFVAPFSATLDPTGTFIAQGWGTSLLGLGVASWVVRDAGAPARRAVAIADAVEWFATAALFALGIVTGTVNILAALWVVLGVLFGAAFAAAVAGVVFRDSEASA